MDKDGGAVSFTSTLNLLFGSHVMDPVTGIILNCQQEDFSSPGLDNIFGYAPSPMNFIKPGKRPLSSISPIMIENEQGQLEMVMGSSGGSQIVSGVLNVLVKTLDFKQGLFEAVVTPRLHHQLMPNEIGVEAGFDPKILEELSERGHEASELISKNS